MSAPLAGKMAGGNKGEKFLCEMSLGEIGASFSQKTGEIGALFRQFDA